jgi:hypothetical protein
MFNRALGMVTPIEQESQKGLDICWVDCNDPNVQHKFDEKLREFEALLDKPSAQRAAASGGRGDAGAQVQQHTVTLQFFKSMVERGWLSDTKKRKTWEEWKLPLTILPPAGAEAASSAEQRRKLSQELRERMMKILHDVDAKKDHLPEISKPQGPAPVGVTYEWDLFMPDSGGGRAAHADRWAFPQVAVDMLGAK